MENNELNEKEKEEIIENTVILETKSIIEKAKEKEIENSNKLKNKKLKIHVKRFNSKPNKKFKIGIEKILISLSILLVILIILTLYGIIAIKSSVGIIKEQKWEYKTVTVIPDTKKNRMGTGAGDFNMIEQSEEQLNQLGSEGWELVGNYLEMETAYPNLASQKNVTGIQPNIRPQDVVLLFKRPINVK